ncbi:peptide ABC transporter substrate-binding protein [Nguyenibacter sp. L1]|uniref:peptide ABC transporter substrate-binding protein n=1 Tax=Nguyenibacter sp. L1 TaxID=3049350 RepID=UPI002B4921D9|nr:peptide ABC transporter substrate-binding protein [Nguyenibacter sp. L1]WRH89889.1 peptide ABC transporter substrate-binding protein [Nguyenibacter sp. L1]
MGTLQPDLAVTVPSVSNGGISLDGRDWRVTLRPDATWHDGQPVTIADILFTLNCLRDPAFPAFSRTGVELIDDIRQTGPRELTWRMHAPYAPLPAVLASVMIVPAHRLAHDGDRQAFSTNPVGSGPFMWGGRIPSEEIRLAANPHWHLGMPGVDRVIIRYIPDITVMFTQFETGEIDFLGMQGIPPDRYAQARALAGRRPIRAPQPFIEGMAFNLGRPQFQDPTVRTAIYEAIDKDTILETICENVEQTTESFLPRESTYFDATLPRHRFDPQAARARLDRAGWRPGPDGVRRRDGIRLEFTNATTAGNPIRTQIQEVIQESLLDIGVVMRIENRPAAVMWGAYWTRSQFDSALVSVDYMTGSDPDASPYFQSDRSPGPRRHGAKRLPICQSGGRCAVFARQHQLRSRNARRRVLAHPAVHPAGPSAAPLLSGDEHRRPCRWAGKLPQQRQRAF